MSHLTCIEHGRRVMYTTTSIIHRNGDGSKCNSELFKFYKGLPLETREDLRFDALRRESAATKVWHDEFEKLWVYNDLSLFKPERQEYEGRWILERPKDDLLTDVFNEFLELGYQYQEMLTDLEQQEDTTNQEGK